MGIRVLAGEGLKLGKDKGTKIEFGELRLKKKNGWFAARKYSLKQVVEVQEINEEDFRTLGGTAGWRLVGVAVAGPLGALFGGYFGGRKNNVTAAVKLDDDFKFLAEFSASTYRKLTKHYKRKVALEKSGLSGLGGSH